jgi:hypothetical protein
MWRREPGLDKGVLIKRIYGQSSKEVSMGKPVDLLFLLLPLRRRP